MVYSIASGDRCCSTRCDASYSHYFNSIITEKMTGRYERSYRVPFFSFPLASFRFVSLSTSRDRPTFHSTISTFLQTHERIPIPFSRRLPISNSPNPDIPFDFSTFRSIRHDWSTSRPAISNFLNNCLPIIADNRR